VHYLENLAMCESLARELPETDVDAQVAWANAYARLADAIHLMGNEPDALKHYQKELEITKKLEIFADNNIQMLTDCSISYDHVSKLCIALKLWDQAIEVLNKGYALKIRAIELDPDHRRCHTLIFRPCIRRGLVYQKLGKPDEALKAYQHGLQVLTTFNNKHPDKEIAENIADIQKAMTEFQNSQTKPK